MFFNFKVNVWVNFHNFTRVIHFSLRVLKVFCVRFFFLDTFTRNNNV